MLTVHMHDSRAMKRQKETVKTLDIGQAVKEAYKRCRLTGQYLTVQVFDGNKPVSNKWTVEVAD